MVRSMQLRQRAHVHVALCHMLHLKVLIVGLHVRTVRRLRSRVGRALGKVCWVRDLIRSFARRRLCRRWRLHDCIVLNESLELLKVQRLVVDIIKV